MSELNSYNYGDLLQKEKEYLKNGEALTARDIADEFDITIKEAKNWKYILDHKDIIHDDVSVDKILRRQKMKILTLSQLNKKLHDRLEKCDLELYHIREISRDINELSKMPVPKRIIRPGYKTPAVAFGILSDVHFEEAVSKAMTNGNNEYNPTIATERLMRFFENFLLLVEKERFHSDIKVACIGFLGDFITGHIHDDLIESNHLSPLEAISEVQKVLIKGLEYLVEYGNFDKIIVPCVPGNHGRTTSKKRFATGYKNSFEMHMYDNLQLFFSRYSKGKDKIEFLTSQNELVYKDFFDYTVRFGHGDHFGYGNGGTGPLIKWLSEMNKQKHADMTFIGHWHKILLEPTSDAMVNGSVIGLNSYAMQFGGYNTRPQQIFALLDQKKGFTMRTHIEVTDI